MATHPQSPKASASCSLAVEPTISMEAAAATELPVSETKRVVREQELLMPIKNVARIMCRVLPHHAKVADDARQVIQECVSEFISFVTNEANDRCHSEHRKTVTADDILWATERLGFEDYIVALRTYIQRMRDWEGTGGRGDRVHHRGMAPPVSVAALHGQQAAQPAAFRNTAPAHGYGVPVQVPFSAAPRFGAQQNMLGGERSIAAAYFGQAPVTAASHGGGCTNETTSSNEELPATATTPRPQYPN